MISFLTRSCCQSFAVFASSEGRSFVYILLISIFLTFLKAPPSDAPVVDTAEQVYISSLALLKVHDCTVTCQLELVYPGMGSLFVAAWDKFLLVLDWK